jgi:hypothetical protein
MIVDRKSKIAREEMIFSGKSKSFQLLLADVGLFQGALPLLKPPWPGSTNGDAGGAGCGVTARASP